MTTTATKPASPEEKARERFTADTAEHQMTVALDQGLYRHLRFRKPDTSFYWFDIITWPGHLTLAGDMGTWTFARTEDMFEFFRDKRAEPSINPGYWGEKLRSGNESGNRTCEEYDGDRFTQLVNEYVEQRTEDWPADVRAELDASVKDHVLTDDYGNTPPHNETLAQEGAYGFHFSRDVETKGSFGAVRIERYALDFQDAVCDWTLWAPSVHFLWCCWAIVHGITAYDAAKAAPAAPEE